MYFLLGILFMFLSGFCWIFIGAVSSYDAKHSIDHRRVMVLCNLLQAAVFLPIMLCSNEGIWDNWTAPTMFLGGILNFTLYYLTSQSMKYMHNGLAWVIMQSSMIFPFLMGIAIFNERILFTRIIGCAIILLGLFLTVFSKAENKTNAPQKSNPKTFSLGLALALSAMVLSGICQCCLTLPSYFPAEHTLPPYSRGFWSILGNMFPILVLMWKREFYSNLRPSIWPIIFLMLVNAIPMLFFFYQGLEYLVACSAGGIGYPISLGTCVAGFALYSIVILKEKGNFFVYASTIATLAGIILISL